MLNFIHELCSPGRGGYALASALPDRPCLQYISPRPILGSPPKFHLLGNAMQAKASSLSAGAVWAGTNGAPLHAVGSSRLLTHRHICMSQPANMTMRRLMHSVAGCTAAEARWLLFLPCMRCSMHINIANAAWK